ncbi:hypothetical protein AAFF_G00015810 [Aldrovandia affinis]|uniref:Hyaluronan and proteoglycan link protein 3 n=1 Tax=Aldrovandia affinis TaxID=143900 RepID=A0AAD7S6E1_9TELE|nr:hypothetical protein AAFF_G00015810 [Aldrovandia affinis]
MILRSKTSWSRLLVAGLLQLQLLRACLAVLRYSNGFFYDDNGNGNGKKEIYFNGVRLHVESEEAAVFGVRGGSVTLPCRFWYEPALSAPRRTRVKWSWQGADGPETEVLVALGSRHRSFGDFRGRARLSLQAPGQAALLLTGLRLNDTGRYRCEVIDGLEDQSVTIDLALRGVVFPYQPTGRRYQLNFSAAQQACEEQDSTLATFEQLFWAWEEGLDCYGPRNRQLHRYDAFCFSAALTGDVYFLQSPHGLNFSEALRACERGGSQAARVGQLYAAWRFAGLDRCDAGWLADGSLRYPITRPRQNCGPPEQGVRNFGFPSQNQKHGVYCYRAH